MIVDPFLSAVLRGIKRSVSTYGIIDPGVVLQEARPYNQAAGGEFAKLITSYNSPALIGTSEYFIQRLHELTRQRAVADAVRGAVQALNDEKCVSDDVIADLQRTILDVDRELRIGSCSTTAQEIGERSYQKWMEAKDTGFRAMTTGFSRLDSKIGGFYPEQLVILAGRTSEGKSALMQQMADHNALLGAKVLYVNLEMSEYELWARFISQRINASLGALIKGRDLDVPLIQTPEEIGAATDVYKASGLRYLNSSSIKVSEIAAEARRLKLTGGLDLLVVDYLQLLTPEFRSESREREVATSCRALKALARELHIPVIAAAQLNRRATGTDRDGERVEPELHHLRESGAIEQDCDVGLLIHRPEKESSEVVLFVEKNRNGPRYGRLDFRFDGLHCKFYQQDREGSEDDDEPKF